MSVYLLTLVILMSPIDLRVDNVGGYSETIQECQEAAIVIGTEYYKEGAVIIKYHCNIAYRT